MHMNNNNNNMGFPILACLLAGFASAAASIGASVSAPEQPENFFCGAGKPPEDLVQFHRRQLNLDQIQSLQHRALHYEDDDDYRIRKWEWKPVTVPVYHHILYSKIACPLLTVGTD